MVLEGDVIATCVCRMSFGYGAIVDMDSERRDNWVFDFMKVYEKGTRIRKSVRQKEHVQVHFVHRGYYHEESSSVLLEDSYRRLFVFGSPPA